MRTFIHIPKTGGTSLHTSPAWKYLGHQVIIDEPYTTNPIYAHKEHQKHHLHNSVVPLNEVDDTTIFATVRNPYSWLLSWFDFMGGFEEFDKSRNFSETRLAQTGFENFINTIMTRDTYWPNKKFIFFQLFVRPSGNLVVDYILHTENLDTEFNIATGFSSPGKRDKLGTRHKKGFTTGEWYDKFPGLAAKVFDVYHREFWLYGYNEDPHILEHDEKDAILTGNVVDKQDHVWYDWDTNELGIGHKMFHGNSRGI